EPLPPHITSTRWPFRLLHVSCSWHQMPRMHTAALSAQSNPKAVVAMRAKLFPRFFTTITCAFNLLRPDCGQHLEWIFGKGRSQVPYHITLLRCRSYPPAAGSCVAHPSPCSAPLRS